MSNIHCLYQQTDGFRSRFHISSTNSSCVRRIQLSCLSLVFSVAVAGCSGGTEKFDLASLQGQIKLDGQPLANALVTFSPADGRRESYGITDQSGYFELRYNSRTKGVEIGEHEVRICSPSVDPKSERSEQEGKSAIPAQYSGKNFLIREVVRGSNRVTLELQGRPDGSVK